MKRQRRRVLQLQQVIQGASQQKTNHVSPLSSVKQFILKALRLSPLHGETAPSPPEDDDFPTIAHQRHPLEAYTQYHDPQDIQTFLLLSHPVPGPSKATDVTLKTETLQRSPSFIEIKSWWKEEPKRICEENDLELNYLEEDSPLKGKGNAVWKKKEPDLDMWKRSGGLVASLACPEPALLQGRMMEREIYSTKTDHRSGKPEIDYDEVEVRFHRRHGEAKALNDIVVKIEKIKAKT
jgi:hypothetical protein